MTDEEKDIIQVQWTLLADIIERLSFYVFLIVSVFTLLGILSQAPNAGIF